MIIEEKHDVKYANPREKLIKILFIIARQNDFNAYLN